MFQLNDFRREDDSIDLIKAAVEYFSLEDESQLLPNAALFLP